MTSPVQEPPRGRSPGAILAALAVILLLCGAVIAWDQLRGPSDNAGVTPPATSGTTAPAPTTSGSTDGFDGLK